MRGKIYITPRSITKNKPTVLKKLEDAGFDLIYAPSGEQPTVSQQMSIIPDCVAYLAGAEKISRKIMENAPKLRIISRNGVGVENIDLDAAKELGIIIKTTPGENSRGVAELAIALIFAAVRSIPLSDRNIKMGKWNRKTAFELRDKTLGIIGCGNIGKHVATMALGIGMIVLAYDLCPDELFHPSNRFQYCTLEDLISKSDIITLHCPPSQNPVIGQNQLNSMKSGVILVNTARAGVVDAQEILDALNSETLMCYATDVYQTEPPKIDALIQHERCICTPHIGGYTQESITRAVDCAVNNILDEFSNNKGST
ncbi:MAG: phosphoglycerate dehydrogenase [Candidatus Lokiarchaeota archaeon]|nr:phosphoglycerate dehydrogenase [Candidatus Lokiarchaeota archaeon]